MLTVLINITIVWLCSLLVYELLLKRETIHRLNRYYLLFAFTAGIFLPMLPWGQKIQVINVRQALPHTSDTLPGSVSMTPDSPVAMAGHTINWWLLIYLTGVLISALYLAAGFLRLWSLYRGARKHKTDGWVIAETGMSQTPFSFLHIIFVSSREDYNDEQWRMILVHEQQHFRCRHLLDLSLMQLAAIVFWFHPLVYVYRYKLRLLHEYEADSKQQDDIQTYGRFLLEQAVLKPAPEAAHSLSFSPLRDRIQMMTRNHSKSSVRYRFLLIGPLLVVFAFCCGWNRKNTAVIITQDGKSLKSSVTVRGNVVVLPPVTYETVAVANVSAPDEPAQPMMFATQAEDLVLNGEKITPSKKLLGQARCKTTYRDNLLNYVIENAGLAPMLCNMNDGNYSFYLKHVIVNKQGRIVYYEVSFPDAPGAMPDGTMAMKQGLETVDQRAAFNALLAEAIADGELAFTPGRNKEGEIVDCSLPDEAFMSRFAVKNHKLSFL